MLDALSGFSADYPLSVPSAPVFAEVQAYDVRGRRFGYCPDVARIGVDPEIERLCQAAVRDLEHAGAIVEPIDLDLSPGREAFLAMRGLWVVGQQYERLDDLSVFGVNVANNIRLGLGITVKDLARADHVRGENWRRLSAILRTHDALLTPCVPVEPFPADRNYPTEIAGKPMSTYIDWIAPTFLFSMMGVPAASVPAGLSKAGLPVGLQIIGPRFHEGRARRRPRCGAPAPDRPPRSRGVSAASREPARRSVTWLGLRRSGAGRPPMSRPDRKLRWGRGFRSWRRSTSNLGVTPRTAQGHGSAAGPPATDNGVAEVVFLTDRNRPATLCAARDEAAVVHVVPAHDSAAFDHAVVVAADPNAWAVRADPSELNLSGRGRRREETGADHNGTPTKLSSSSVSPDLSR